MAPLKEKSANAAPNTSPNTSRKRKSDISTSEEPSKSAKNDAPAVKRARKSTTSKSDSEPKPAATKQMPASSPTSDAKSEKTTNTTSTKEKASSRAAKPDTDNYDVSDITLSGEPTGQVPIFDTASDLRTKINTHTRTAPKSHSSNAALVRAFEKSFPLGATIPEGISPRSLKTFLAKKGSNGGVSMPIFYAAYVYFEKLRIKQGKKKTKKREEMEASWGPAGLDLRNDSDGRMLMLGDERCSYDKYGHLSIINSVGQVRHMS